METAVANLTLAADTEQGASGAQSGAWPLHVTGLRTLALGACLLGLRLSRQSPAQSRSSVWDSHKLLRVYQKLQ